MKKLLFTLALTLVTFMANAQTYTYDVNHDGIVNVTDITYLVNHILGVVNPGDEQNVPSLALSSTTINLTTGSSELVEIISGSGNYAFSIGATAVVTVTISGTSIMVTAMGEGQATVTVTDIQSGQVATIQVAVDNAPTPHLLSCPDDHHPHAIDLGLPSGTMWACCNVGANTPTANGGYFAWGETEMKNKYNWSTYNYCAGTQESCIDLGDIAGTEYDVAHVQWGGSWQMPSFNQFKELVDNCTYEETTQDRKKGFRFTGMNGGTIFLPAAGIISDEGQGGDGSFGSYWSTSSINYFGFGLYFYNYYNKDEVYYSYPNYRYYGLPVRAVTGN